MSKPLGRPHARQNRATVPLHDPHPRKQSPWSKAQHSSPPLAAAAYLQRHPAPSTARLSGLEQLSATDMQQFSMPVSNARHPQGQSTPSPSAESAPGCEEPIDTIVDSSNDWLAGSLGAAPDLLKIPSLVPIEGFSTDDAFDFSLPGTEGFSTDNLLDMWLSETDDTEGGDIFWSTPSCLSGSSWQPALHSPTAGLPLGEALQPEQLVHVAQHQQADTSGLAASNNVHKPGSTCSTPAQPGTPPAAFPTAETQPDSVTRCRHSKCFMVVPA